VAKKTKLVKKMKTASFGSQAKLIAKSVTKTIRAQMKKENKKVMTILHKATREDKKAAGK